MVTLPDVIFDQYLAVGRTVAEHVDLMFARYAGVDLIQIDHRLRIERAVISRLFEGVAISETGCWVSPRCLRNGVHASMGIHDHPEYVHRISYGLAFDAIPAGLLVCHECDVGNCIWPSHLFLGTDATNVADMEDKGRARKVCPRGANNPNATLSDEDVDRLRAAAAIPGTSQRSVATRFGVSQSTVWRLVHGVVRA